MLLLANSALLFLSAFFILSPHPLMMGLIIMTATIFVIILMYFTLQLAWVTFMIFLIYMGALLILFMYVVSLAPNENFPSNPLKTTSVLTLVVTPFVLLNLSRLNLQAKSLEPFFSYTKLYSSSMFPLTLIMVFSLLLTLISIIFISKPKLGALRNKSN